MRINQAYTVQETKTHHDGHWYLWPDERQTLALNPDHHKPPKGQKHLMLRNTGTYHIREDGTRALIFVPEVVKNG